MATNPERRRAARVVMNLPCTLTYAPPVIEEQPRVGDLLIERIPLPDELAGEVHRGTLVDLSENGARITADVIPPLFCRLEVAFDFPEFGKTRLLALVMWRTKISKPTKMEDGRTGTPAFGVLYEAASIDLRMAIAKAVSQRGVGQPPSF